MKMFTIGGSGLVGSRIAELLKDTYQIDDLSLTSGVDITDPASLEVIRNDKEHDVVLHIAAKADVDGCEADKEQGENGLAYKINVGGTQHVVDACKVSGKKMLYISTDFVFDGKKEPPSNYTEEDTPEPINWYAMTKYKGEEVVKNSGIAYAILRIAYPYRADEFEVKKDFVHAVMGRLSQNLPITAVTDHMMTPTFVDDIAFGIDAVIKDNATGIYHLVGDQSLSPYDAFQLLAEKFGYDKNLIGKTTREEYFKGKAPRPFNLSLDNAKIEQLGVTMRSFEEGLHQIKG
ncbi:MAG TPA: SDR family oxidoreductase [Candidatus Saccharimonadales bacterium]|nr:SDR family oxidoreductase [Candidatus Saccharimonadales bacterium]